MIDTTNEFGARVQQRLSGEQVIWLITVGTDGTPQPSPVWFLWNDQTILIYSRPNTPKLRNISHNPKVALHFDSDGQGGNIVVLTGEARIDENTQPADQVTTYLAKYQASINRLGMTPRSFADTYSVAISVRPNNVRGN
jgi:PPOX class probable F420-dependent enzyme